MPKNIYDKTNKNFNPRLYSYEEVRDLSVRDINRAFRKNDESHLWPICGKFNATERAIRRLRKWYHDYGERNMGGYEYCLSLEREISNIVNSEA